MFFISWKSCMLLSLMKLAKSVHIMGSLPFIKTAEDLDYVPLLESKGYLPNESIMPKITFNKYSNNDANIILSKLSDDELIKVLKEYPKKNEYHLNDFIKKSEHKTLNVNNDKQTNDNKVEQPIFKLNHREVDAFAFNKEGDPKYNAFQKISNVLYSHPQEFNSDESEDNKEMLFDVLVAQLKSLCCKRNKYKKRNSQLRTLLQRITSKSKKPNLLIRNYMNQNTLNKLKEYIFLVINDEIKTNATEELIQVDPDSLAKNSSVLLLGPINTPLTEEELKLVIKRISNELIKPEYLPLLQKLSEGSLNENNSRLMNSIITGAGTRRYIKPHRCNHQSKLARIYGGPKWLICTGYLNLNTPSLYD